jgi:hypothetical protein
LLDFGDFSGFIELFVVHAVGTSSGEYGERRRGHYLFNKFSICNFSIKWKDKNIIKL